MADAIVIGGGITGAGVARDLALRGWKVELCEKSAPGGATTASSTHLIHGGLRYLLYDRVTTQTTCWDSGHILRIAGPLLTRLPILWPVYAGHRHGLETVETLLESYDRLQNLKGGLPHVRLTPAETLRVAPGLSPAGLRGSLMFDEWWVDPVKLVEANLRGAEAAGAVVRRDTAVEGLVLEGGAVRGVELRAADGRRAALRAPVVVNAAGPWVDRVAGLAGLKIPLRLQKGTHLVYEGAAASKSRVGFLLEAEDRSRYVFVVPGPGTTLVGPTDVATGEDPDRLTSSEEEVRYLLASVRRYFPDFPERFTRTSVGARPILGQAGTEKQLSREFQVLNHAERDGVAGFVTIAGGKMSDFRLMAEETGDAVGRLLGKSVPCRSHLVTLDGHPVDRAPGSAPPGRALKNFLRLHPRLREAHALAHLAAGFARHAARRLAGGRTGGDLRQYGI